jgi:hypothetical protein
MKEEFRFYIEDGGEKRFSRFPPMATAEDVQQWVEANNPQWMRVPPKGGEKQRSMFPAQHSIGSIIGNSGSPQRSQKMSHETSQMSFENQLQWAKDKVESGESSFEKEFVDFEEEEKEEVTQLELDKTLKSVSAEIQQRARANSGGTLGSLKSSVSSMWVFA